MLFSFQKVENKCVRTTGSQTVSACEESVTVSLPTSWDPWSFTVFVLIGTWEEISSVIAYEWDQMCVLLRSENNELQRQELSTGFCWNPRHKIIFSPNSCKFGRPDLLLYHSFWQGIPKCIPIHASLYPAFVLLKKNKSFHHQKKAEGKEGIIIQNLLGRRVALGHWRGTEEAEVSHPV